MNIFVSNIAFGLEEKDLHTLFSDFGMVETVKLIIDKRSGKSKGYGFVEMPNENEASTAINMLNGREIFGRELRVAPAKKNQTDASDDIS